MWVYFQSFDSDQIIDLLIFSVDSIRLAKDFVNGVLHLDLDSYTTK